MNRSSMAMGVVDGVGIVEPTAGLGGVAKSAAARSPAEAAGGGCSVMARGRVGDEVAGGGVSRGSDSDEHTARAADAGGRGVSPVASLRGGEVAGGVSRGSDSDEHTARAADAGGRGVSPVASLRSSLVHIRRTWMLGTSALVSEMFAAASISSASAA